MNSKIYFETTLNIGKLYLDKVFNTFEDEAIVFVCIDDNHDYYFCICYEFRNALKWIINRIPIDILQDIIMRRVTLYDGITYGKYDKIECEYSNNDGEHYRWIKKENLNDNILPTKNVYLRPDYNLDEYLCILNISSESLYNKIQSTTYKTYEKINSQIDISTGTEAFIETFWAQINNYQSNYPCAEIVSPINKSVDIDVAAAA